MSSIRVSDMHEGDQGVMKVCIAKQATLLDLGGESDKGLSFVRLLRRKCRNSLNPPGTFTP